MGHLQNILPKMQWLLYIHFFLNAFYIFIGLTNKMGYKSFKGMVNKVIGPNNIIVISIVDIRIFSNSKVSSYVQ